MKQNRTRRIVPDVCWRRRFRDGLQNHAPPCVGLSIMGLSRCTNVGGGWGV